MVLHNGPFNRMQRPVEVILAVGGMGGLVGIEEDMKEKQPGCVCHVNMICMNI